MKPNFIPSQSSGNRIEPLEQRIAPAALPITNTVAAVVGSPLVLHAGDVLSTSATGGAYFMFVEKGDAIVFTTDLNNNFQLDFNEITGIAAGNGLRLISFVDIHGDIVTNLRADGQRLTDSDNDATTGFDGRVLTNSQIEKIELRSLTLEDLPLGTNLPDRLALSSYSLFGNIYAGRGFGATDGGLIIDKAGVVLQQSKFTGTGGFSKFIDVPPQIGSIKVGTAASGELFSFGTSPAGRGLGFNGEDVQGALLSFRTPAGQDGADISGVRIADGITPFNLGTLQAGDGGFNGRGGNISNIQVTGDRAGGYSLIAGNAGDGTVGKSGGSITGYTDLGSVTSQVILQSGNGGRGLLGAGGPGGIIDLSSTTPTNIAGRLFVNLGNGGDGLTSGGAGTSLQAGSFITPEGDIPFALNVASSTRSIGDIYNTISTVTDENGDVTVLTIDDPRYHAIHSFDFDRDGTNDIVYTNRNPDQLVVVFGFPGGGLDPQGLRYPGAPGSIYLNAPANPEALVVADLNGDGLPDIASAAQDNSFAGVSVYISKYATDPATGLPSTFLGFYDPIQSPLPHVANYFDNLLNSYYQAAYKITNLVAGDFDGDGVMDLGLNSIQQVIGTSAENNVIFIMRGDANAATAPKGTGYFFADFVNSGGLALPYDDGFHGQPYSGRVVLKASALEDGGRDFLFSASIDRREMFVYDYATFDASTPLELALGRVDTNRDVSDPDKRDKISLEDARMKDFTLLDLDNNGFADIAVVTNAPANYLVVFEGNGAPEGFLIASNDPVDDTSGRDGENSGIPLSEAAPKGLELPDTLVGILTTASDDGLGNDLALVDYNRDSGHNLGFREVTFSDLVPRGEGDPPATPPVFFVAAAATADGGAGTALPLDES
ncbi:MAG TPA: VCBS repeat-containing protein, partial [Chthoniobacteraceae bacterium]|nr:VCBS repeat-containing protein [Chthoniobacteraceae bacterium]